MADGCNFSGLLRKELVIDLFAGGGGASMGISRAYREPDVAINHNAIAVAVHRANHPNTAHYTCDVFEVDPLVATGGQPVAVLWASPDCRHHSKAAGGKPRSKRVRGLAWVVTKWATAVRPRLIHLENVEEFADWGPLMEDGRPDQVRKGITFRRWVRSLTRLGYKVEWRELIAANYGAPTIRKRLYVIARCDGAPIAWPAATHSKATGVGLKPWRMAAECIDFTLPANSIFTRKKPLAVNTCKRVAKGMWRYVLNNAEPFIVGCGGRMGQSPPRGMHSPVQTITAKADSCLATPILTPFLTEHANASTQRTFAVDEPLRTQCAAVKGGHFSLIAPTLIQAGHGEGSGATRRRSHGIKDIRTPLGTVCASGGGHALATAFLEQANGGFYTGDGRDVRAPLSTITTSGTQQRLVTAYAVKYYGTARDGVPLTSPMHTVSTKDRMGLVQCVQVSAETLAPELRDRAKAVADFLREYLPEHFTETADMVLVGDYVLVDITLRMLVPRELAKAQGFHADYIIDRGLFEAAVGSGEYEWRPISKTDQVRLIGNSVCPDVSEALVRANAADLINTYARIAA